MAERASGTAIAALFISIFSVGVAIVMPLLVTAYNTNTTSLATQQTTGYYCTQWVTWVTDRIDDGMSDRSIAEFSALAVEAGGDADVLAKGIVEGMFGSFPTTSASGTGTGAPTFTAPATTATPSAVGTASAVASLTTPTSNPIYRPCGLRDAAEIVQKVSQIRAALRASVLPATPAVATTT